MAEDELEFETSRTRQEIAAFFRSLAEQLAGDDPVTVTVGDEAVGLVLPERSMLEVEIEEEATGETSFEVELVGDIEVRRSGSEDESPPTAARLPDDFDGDGAGEGRMEPSDPSAGEETVRSSLGRFELFRDKRDEWRWRLVHRNGNIIATSGEGYTTRRNAKKGLESVKRNAPDAQIFLVDRREIDDGDR